MSSFESYDEAAQHYDRTRIPIGCEIILEYLHAHLQTPARVALLDAGCGTGAYAAALAGRVGRVIGIDQSAGMLEAAHRKLASTSQAGTVALCRGNLHALPFSSGSLDAVMFNQVLHHLEDGQDPAYGGHERALGEAFRVLKPGGLLTINACTHEQLRRGFWFYALIPGALEAVLARCIGAEQLRTILERRGFVLRGQTVPRNAVLQGNAYFDPHGPLRPEWRRGDSIWSLALPGEIARAEAAIREFDTAGRLADFVARQDATRKDCGQVTFFLAARQD